MSLNIFHNPTSWLQYHQTHLQNKETLGFVPTMGALHEGHLSLLQKAKSENDKVLVSIFVNPTQFNDSKDFQNYPTNFEADLEILKQAGADYVLAPSSEQMYPDGFKYKVQESEVSQILEGAVRPGHFEGMLTVVLKLLNISQAERAYFGEKDFQQLALIRGMVEAFFLPVQIVACPTTRAQDGLALSSRNARLSVEDRKKAALFPLILKQKVEPAQIQRTLANEGFEVEYVEDWAGRRLGAVRIGDIRLIDNVEGAKL